MKQSSAAFTVLYNEYASSIHKLCMGYTGDAAMAQDLLQETFIRVWNNMQHFREESKWSTWIYRIAVNTCLTWLRKNKVPLVDADSEALALISEPVNNSEQQLQSLYTCISRLAETDRLIIALVLEEKPYDEIAEITGITENNLRVKIHRIKKQLSEIYNSYERF
ncbi:MAG: sigma-70 family RNA polymerase sigma factor [Chitinophagaceae bacterium]